MLHMVAESLFMLAASGGAAVVALMLVSEAEAVRGALVGAQPVPVRRAWNDRVKLVSRRPALTRRALRSLREAA